MFSVQYQRWKLPPGSEGKANKWGLPDKLSLTFRAVIMVLSGWFHRESSWSFIPQIFLLLFAMFDILKLEQPADFTAAEAG